MPKLKCEDCKYRLQKIVDILNFVLTLDEEDLIKTSIESVIETLEEEIQKDKKSR